MTQIAATAKVADFLADTSIEGTELEKLKALALACVMAAAACTPDAPSPAPPIWRQIPAEWSSHPRMVRAIVEWNGSVLIGTERSEYHGGEIYRVENGALKKRAGFSAQRVQSLTIGPDNALYVGVGTNQSTSAMAGRYLTDTLVGDYFGGSAPHWEKLKDFTGHSFVYAQAWFQGKLHVGLMKSFDAGNAEVWRFDDPAWTKIGGPGVNGWPADDPAFGTYELWEHAGELYASTFALAGTNGAIYRLTAAGWVDTQAPATQLPLTMASYDGDLVAGLQNNNHNPVLANPIVRYRDGAWEPLGVAPAEWSGAWLPNHMTVGPDGKLYVGFGGDLGKLSVWSYDGQWTKLAGDGLNGSWTGALAASPATAEWIYRLLWSGGKLYVGIAANGGQFAALWEMTP